MSAPQLKLTYFNATGRAELTRLALAYGELEFTDTRMQYAQWPEIKPTTPIGQVPMLEVDGVKYCQSMALARYAARLSGLYPTDPLEALKIEMVAESLVDAHNVYTEIKWRVQDEALKAEKSKAFLAETLPKTFSFLESRVEGAYFLGDKPTLADLHLYDVVVNTFEPFFGDLSMSKYPKLQGVVDAVKALPTIKAYLDKAQKA